MKYQSLNPFTAEVEKDFPTATAQDIENALAQAREARVEWADTPYESRGRVLHRAAELLEQRSEEYAAIITREMGKLAKEAKGEVEKCAWVCRFYADNGADFLADERVKTEMQQSYIAFQPLGTVFAVMPWNFPFWQVFRFAAPALMAGNTGILKHAPNVPQCAAAIADIWREAGLPDGVFQNLYLSNEQAAQVIADDRVHAVTLTGSDRAGSAVAAEAGRALKKCVLELGGSDPFIVLDDADLDWAVEQGVTSRYQNAGQSCIAAKRFIVVDDVADEFLSKFQSNVEALKPGDPSDSETTLAPMARKDLRDALHEQVQDAQKNGAKVLCGGAAGEGKGWFYQATILDGVKPGMRAWTEEVFGPVALVIRVKDEIEALEVANSVDFGLGGSVWTRDIDRGRKLALQLESGSAFVNSMVKSDPRLPFGGIKKSGFGRELATLGIREFVNAKTVAIK